MRPAGFRSRRYGRSSLAEANLPHGYELTRLEALAGGPTAPITGG